MEVRLERFFVWLGAESIPDTRVSQDESGAGGVLFDFFPRSRLVMQIAL